MYEDERPEEQDRLEVPGAPYTLALWNLIIRPPRRRYGVSSLGPKEFQLWSCRVERVDIELTNPRGQNLKCSHWLAGEAATRQNEAAQPSPAVVYLHQNASCRLEAMQLVPLFLPLGISVFAFDFSGCGESDGEYISLGWFERDDLATCVDYLRQTGKVSSVGLWGRSMGAVTALLHADRDHSIGGMVLDSPFANLRQLTSELAQSEQIGIKVPSWLLSGVLAVGRLRIRSLCGFDIDELVPEDHVAGSFIPAFFIAADGDDFIQPHHSQRLYEMYNGDKELEIVEGDHNSYRCSSVNRKALFFLCRALRVEPTPAAARKGSLLQLLVAAGGDMSAEPRANRKYLQEACRQLAIAGDEKAWTGQRQRALAPLKVEAPLQLKSADTQAGFCVILSPLPTEYGGTIRPPLVLYAYVTVAGLHVARAREAASPKDLAIQAYPLEVGVPVLYVMELFSRPTRLRLALGSGESELEVRLEEDYDLEAHVWPMTRGGGAYFFDTEITAIAAPPSGYSSASSAFPPPPPPPAAPAPSQEEESSEGVATESGHSDLGVVARSIPNQPGYSPGKRAAEASNSGSGSRDSTGEAPVEESSGMCSQQ